MEKKLVTIYSLDKALAYIKETSGGHSDMFIRDTALLLEWYGVEWKESGEKPESIMSILEDGGHKETDKQLEVREIIDIIAENTLSYPDDTSLWIADTLRRNYKACIKHLEENDLLTNEL